MLRTQIIAGLALSVLLSPANSQTTRHERLAQGLEEITSQDKDVKAVACAVLGKISPPLPEDTFPVAPVFRVQLPDLQFLPLTDLHLADNGEKYALSQWPDLPFGGVAGVDFCAIGNIQYLHDPTLENPETFRSGILLRPGLVLADAYPASFDIIRRQKGRLMSLESGSYLLYKIDKGTKSDVVEQVALTLRHSRTDRFVVRLGDWLYVPE